ncbi:MAG: DUF2851 family protein [Prevotellaceae bacterium]|jgi:hypothetical protein|nr:DUF2851 family protein [Prevotellaceae bacterium]
MNEAFLQYLWQHRLFYPADLRTVSGEKVEIINVGKRNDDAGPDFFNAKIKIGDTVWAGNVEIHLRSSDWKRHKHHRNYDNVILHVVKVADEPVYRLSGEEIPQLVLPYPSRAEAQYESWLANKKSIPCADKLDEISRIFLQSQLNRLLSERLEQKTLAIESLLSQSQNHWEEAFYVTLCRNFGFGINAQPFEMLARSLPLNYLAKHKDNLFQIEALLFGQSGLFNSENPDEYEEKLRKEYHFLQSKFSLTPIDGSVWKMLRIRPSNFPHLRIAQLAGLIHRSSKLFSKIIENPGYKNLISLFDTEVSDYWHTHFRFGQASPERKHKLGKQTIDSLLINTVVPFLFAYGKVKNSDEWQEKAVSLLKEIPAEKNHIIKLWADLNIAAKNAFETQALLQLHKNYCEEKKCLHCAFGYQLLAETK